MLHFPKLTSQDPIWMTVILIESEMQRTLSKGSSIVERLTEVLF